MVSIVMIAQRVSRTARGFCLSKYYKRMYNVYDCLVSMVLHECGCCLNHIIYYYQLINVQLCTINTEVTIFTKYQILLVYKIPTNRIPAI